jgi:LmbE family N-acetylglucosaminyl deacetylase
MRPNRHMRALVVVAHPDDDVIFFGALLRRLTTSGWAVDIVCVVGHFSSPLVTGIRRGEFRRVCGLLGARGRQLPLPDAGGPLDEAMLAQALHSRVPWDSYDLVYTHGVWGEYGHQHHTQVSCAVHRLSPGTLSLAGPLPAELSHALSVDELADKRSLAAAGYPSQPWAASWCTDDERFVHLTTDEAQYAAAVSRAATGPLERIPVPLTPATRELARRSLDGFRRGARAHADIAHIPESLWRPIHEQRRRALVQVLAAPVASGLRTGTSRSR